MHRAAWEKGNQKFRHPINEVSSLILDSWRAIVLVAFAVNAALRDCTVVVQETSCGILKKNIKNNSLVFRGSLRAPRARLLPFPDVAPEEELQIPGICYCL